MTLCMPFRINQTCRAIAFQGQIADTLGLGDCAFYGSLAMAHPTWRPPPSEPTAPQALHVWAVRRTPTGIPGPWETTGELLHLPLMLSKTVVTLGLHLGICCTVVQVIHGRNTWLHSPTTLGKAVLML